ncbi:MAG: UDPGP type 1 family protein [Lachnospiraceae bacterium]|nr:UDPGP type 1 family protein [Lachnospiraceae bacterium]
MTLNDAKAKLEMEGQEHLLKYYNELHEDEREKLLMQIHETDFSFLKHVQYEGERTRGKIEPIDCMTLDKIQEQSAELESLGKEVLRKGKVAAVLLAGGMGTRLGSDAPKGVYNIGKTKERFIFQCLIENIQKVVKDVGVYIPLFIMTSEKNHQQTVDFFVAHDFFGYPEDKVWFFKQQMAPATDFDGKVLLESKMRIATSPNGNGGWFQSMDRFGLVRDMESMGVEYLNVFAVDNVLQKIADPVFIGAVAKEGVEVGAKVVRKNSPDEKVGVVCLEDGHPSIVEYYELTEEMRDEKNADGEYAYNFGVILNYLFRMDALKRMMEKQLSLHVVKKKVPCLDKEGHNITPEEPNAYKYEQLVLDMIQDLDSCLPFEVVREKEFAPIKNPTGIDSVESAQKLLEENGVVL